MANDTKERLLAAALEMFLQYGYAGTNIRELSASLGLVKTGVYKHYESKEAVWNAMITASVHGHEEQHAAVNLIHKIMLIGEYSLIQSFSLCLLTQQVNCSTIALQGGDSMAMESTLQVRMDSALKAEVEALYKSLGTSFAEAVRIFAQQSIREGGMPFTPSLKAWDELTQDEIDARLRKSMADVSAGRVLSQDQLDAKMREKFTRE